MKKINNVMVHFLTSKIAGYPFSEKLRRACFIGGLLSAFQVSYAQQGDWETQGTLEDAKVLIEKERTIDLPNVSRNFEKVPPLPRNEAEKAPPFSFQTYHPELKPFKPGVRILKVKKDSLEKLYGNHLIGGFGNYANPYFEAFLNNTRNEEYAYGLHGLHNSFNNGPVDGSNSATSQNRINGYGRFFLQDHTFYAKGGYNRDVYHFYGYNPDLEVEKDSIQQIFNVYSLQTGLVRTDYPGPWQYELHGSFYRMTDHDKAEENQVNINLKTHYQLSDGFNVGVVSDLFTSGLEDGSGTSDDERNRTLFRLRPEIRFESDSGDFNKFEATLGLNAVYEDDTINNAGQLHPYPYLSGKYYINPDLNIFAKLNGDIEKVSLLSMIKDNPWLASDVPVIHTNRKFHFETGLRGKISPIMDFTTGIAYSTYSNALFYVNGMDSTRFMPVYNDLNRVHFYAETHWEPSSNVNVWARGDIYDYDGKAYHRPGYKLESEITYNIFDKIWLGTSLHWVGGITGYNIATDREKDLDDIFDWNIKVDYRFSKKFSTYLKFNNILNQKYERYMNYPSRAFMLQAGMSYSF